MLRHIFRSLNIVSNKNKTLQLTNFSALNVTTIIIASRNIGKKKVSKINATLLSLDGKLKRPTLQNQEFT